MTGRARVWATVGALWLATVCSVAYEIAPASVLPLVREGLAVGPAGASWLVGVFLLAMAIFSIPSGLVLDRVDERRAILLTTVALALSTVWAWRAGTAGDYHAVLVARFVGGGLQVAFWTATINVVGAAATDKRQGTAIAFIATAIPGGFAAGHLTGPTLAGAVGWAGTFPVYGLLAVGAITGFWVSSRGLPLTVDAPAPTVAEFGSVLRNRAVWTVAGLAFMAFSLNLFFNSWLPTYLAERFALGLAGGGVLAAGFPLIGVVARLAGGVASDQYFGGRRRPIVLGSFVVVTPLIPAITAVDSVPLLFGGLVVAGIFTQLGLVLLIPLVRELVADNVAATALAVLNTVGFVGAFSAPTIAGTLIEVGGFGAAFGYAALLALAGVGLAATLPESV